MSGTTAESEALSNVVYIEVARRIEAFVQELIDQRETSPQDIADLRRELKRDATVQIDYEHSAATFAGAFLLNNFWKVSAAMQHTRPQLKNRVLDLGTGSAAAALASLAYIAAQPAPHHRQPDVILVDRSQAQLELASTALKYASPPLDIGAVSLIEADLYNLAEDRDHLQSDLVLLSHVLTENAHKVQPLMELAASLTTSGGTILVVERPDDDLWPEVQGHLVSAMPISCDVAELPHWADVPARRARWLALRQPHAHERWLAMLLRDYFTAWRKRSPAAIADVFTADARYYRSPTEAPLRGVEEIMSYWRQRVVPQEDPDPRPLRVRYEGNQAFCDWRAQFRRDGYRFELLGTMVVEGDSAAGRLRCLEEHFETVKIPLDP
jgi:SAM-dependent methyltransferase